MPLHFTFYTFSGFPFASHLLKLFSRVAIASTLFQIFFRVAISFYLLHFLQGCHCILPLQFLQGCQHWRWKSETNHRLHYWRNNLWRNQVFIQNNFLTFELKYPPILFYGNLNTGRVLYSNGISASECKMAPNLSGIWILNRYFNNENERTERIEYLGKNL